VGFLSEVSDEHVDGLADGHRLAGGVVLLPGGHGGAVTPVGIAEAFVEATGIGVVHADAHGEPLVAEAAGGVLAGVDQRGADAAALAGQPLGEEPPLSQGGHERLQVGVGGWPDLRAHPGTLAAPGDRVTGISHSVG
jgi:hypothetical protein